MPLFSAEEPARSPYPGRIHPKLTRFADEFCATLARLFAYVGVLAPVGIPGVDAFDNLQIDIAADVSPPPGWSVADRSSPPFALSPPDARDKSEKPDTYVVVRHPEGGRNDILRWSGPGEKPAAEFEIDRPGSEYGPAATARAGLAAAIAAPGTTLEAFARAKFKRGACTSASADWTEAANPGLRGAF